MSVLKINCKANISDILSGVESGINRNFIVDTISRKRLKLIVLFSCKLQEKGINTYVEVKFSSKYGAREKRIEIVGKWNNIVTLYKITSHSKFDKDALELSKIVSEIKEDFQNFSIKGILLCEDCKNINFINKEIGNITQNVTAELL